MLDSYSKLFADKRLSFLRFHIWMIGILAAFASVLLLRQNAEILATFVMTTIIADILVYKVFKLRESHFKDAETFVKATQITVEQWDAYVQRINKCKIPVLCIALLCNIFVFKFPGYKLPAITSFEYFLIMLFVIQSIGHQMRLPQSSSSKANHFQGMNHPASMEVPMGAMNSMSSNPSYQSDISPFHTVNHDFHSSSFQPMSDFTASSSTVPNYGIPGFDIHGNFTGSPTAIGGMSC